VSRMTTVYLSSSALQQVRVQSHSLCARDQSVQSLALDKRAQTLGALAHSGFVTLHLTMNDRLG